MNHSDVVKGLITVLADSYQLYLKTQNYHWNVTGLHFHSLHLLFEGQYQDLAQAIDVAAELIRACGEKAPATFEAYAKQTIIQPGNEHHSAEQMLKELSEDQVTIQKRITEALKVAQAQGDEVVVNFLVERLTTHRKNEWMLKSSL